MSDEGDIRELSVPRLFRAFFPVLESRELGTSPRRVTLWGRHFVVFRDEKGTAKGLVDACPHRNAPLSMGRCEAGRLTCPYHGWEFAGDGHVTRIPGLVSLEKNYRAQAFDVREAHGVIWLKPDPRKALYEPFELPLSSDPSYRTLVRVVEAEAGIHAICENALDVPHTSILHRGLFRGGKRNLVAAHVRRNHREVEIEYRGEPAPSGIAAWLLSMRAGEGTVTHFDRFSLPGIVQVEYRLGERAHFVVTGFCSPVSEERTKLFAVASFKTPLPGALVELVVEPIALRIFRQDARMLALQSEVFRKEGGPRFVSTEIDAMGPSIWRLLRAATRYEEEGHEEPHPAGEWKSHEFSLLA